MGDVYTVPISHGEGRFLASDGAAGAAWRKAGRSPPSMWIWQGRPHHGHGAFNPNGSVWAMEGITSPDGRVLGKMGHSERIGDNLYRNVPGRYDMQLFTSAVRYFK